MAVIGATVWHFVKDQWLVLLTRSGLLFWVDLASNRAYSRRWAEGQLVWVYYVEEGSRFVSVVENGGESLDSMPDLGFVEL